MLRVEHRQMMRINGLIDDFALYGEATDYLDFAATVESAIQSKEPQTLQTASRFHIEIACDTKSDELYTSLQNHDAEYSSLDDWEQRNTLRIWGNAPVLEHLHVFLRSFPERGQGYSYISEYSEEHPYHLLSPQWRLHVQCS